MSSWCSVSIDLDSIGCYYQIHGLGAAPDALAGVVLERCLPRFVELLDARGIRATFFVVGRDIDTEVHGDSCRAGRRYLADAHEGGHELGNHSYSHPYDMARLERGRVAEEIGRGGELLEELGADVVGFRAPGYDLSPAMLRELDESGYLYDSSIFPAPGYYAAKLAVLAAMRAMGKRSGAVITNPRALAAPAAPYRPSLRAPWRRGHSRLIELPIAVTPGLRIPAIGTSLLLAPKAVRQAIIDAASKRPFFNFELHGIDLADAEEDGLPSKLVARQPDLQLSLEEKRERLEGILDQLGQRFDFGTLAEVARDRQAAL